MDPDARPPEQPLPPAQGLESQPAGDYDFELHRPVEQRRRVVLPIVLFLVTCVSTFWAGAVGIYGLEAFAGAEVFFQILHQVFSWQSGVTYMVAVMGILLAHEMGHFVMTLRHGIPASLPFFIPMPLPPIGTMGAVISMQGSKADRKELFDIGVAGPLAGLVIAVPVLCLGIYWAAPGQSMFSQPLLTKLLLPLLRPDLATAPAIQMNPLLLAGWVGLLITGLNMLPISQLDGGHVAYALFRRRAHLLAHAFLFLAIVFVVASEQMPWVLMLALVVLIGVNHPPTANDNVPLGGARTVLGFASLSIPVLCFPPEPFNFESQAVAALVGLWR